MQGDADRQFARPERSARRRDPVRARRREPYPVRAGGTDWKPGFDEEHDRPANLCTAIANKFVVFMLCAPEAPMMTFLDKDEIGARAQLRPPAAAS